MGVASTFRSGPRWHGLNRAGRSRAVLIARNHFTRISYKQKKSALDGAQNKGYKIMAAKIENLIGSERQTRTDFSIEHTVGVIIHGIPDWVRQEGKINWAINNSGYFFGMEHLDNPLARLARIDCKAISTDAVEMELTYIQNIGQIQVNISTQLYQVETNKTAKRKIPSELIKVAYKYPSGYELDPKLQGKIISKSPTVPKDSHDAILTLTREEVTTYEALLAQVETYANTLNLAGWSIDVSAFGGTYKCIDINAQYKPDTRTYIVTRSFARRQIIRLPDDAWVPGWDIDLYYRDHNTGEPPSDVVAYASVDASGVPDVLPGGIRIGIPIYEQKDFNGLIS